MSWSSIVNKNIKTKDIIIPKEKKYIEKIDKYIEKNSCMDNFEAKHDLDLFDFCFNIKDHMDNNSDLLYKIDSYKIGTFIKKYIDYSRYIEDDESKYDIDSDTQ
jgi:hypothetical protein